MLFLKRNEQPKICPKTGKIIQPRRKFRWPWWLFPFTGLAALNLVSDSCDTEALAGGIPLPACGVSACIGLYRLAIRSGRLNCSFSTRQNAILCGHDTFWRQSASSSAWHPFTLPSALPLRTKPSPPTPPLRVPQPVNAPIGTAKGIHPGRVAWIHDPNATTWGGTSKWILVGTKPYVSNRRQ